MLTLLACVAAVLIILNLIWQATFGCTPLHSRRRDVEYISGRWAVECNEAPFKMVFKPNGVGYNLYSNELRTFGYTIAGRRLLFSQDACKLRYRIVERKENRAVLALRGNKDIRLVLNRIETIRDDANRPK